MSSDMEVTSDREGTIQERDVEGELFPVAPAGELLPKRKRAGSLDDVSISECASVRIPSFPERVRLVGRELDRLLLIEKEKRKISAAAHRSILEIRDRYEVLLDEAFRQNTVLEGRVEEARRSHKCVGVGKVEGVVGEATKKRKGESEGMAKRKEAKGNERKASEGKKGENKEGKKKEGKKVAAKPPAKTPAKETFAEVVSRKTKRKERKRATEVLKAVAATAKTSKAIEKVKARAPARAFIVSVGVEGAGEAKRKLWADLVKGVATPKISNAAKLPRGDLIVRPADDATFKALKSMEEAGGKGVREESARWPTVLIYDVDRELTKERIPAQIVEQNPGLGLDKKSGASSRGNSSSNSVY